MGFDSLFGGAGDWLAGLFSGGGDAVSQGAGAAADNLSNLFGPSNYVGTALGDIGDVASGGIGEQIAGPTAAELGAIASRAAPGGSPYTDAAGRIWSGVRGGFQNVGDFAKSAIPAAQLGLGGLGIASAVKGTQQAAESAKLARRGMALQERAATPLTNFGNQQLQAAQAGNVPAAVQTQINLWKQAAKAKVRDYLARAGISDSSAAVQWDALIDQQAEAMKVAALSDQAQQGTRALAGAAGAASGLTRDAQASQGSMDNLIAQFNQMLGRLAGSAA